MHLNFHLEIKIYGISKRIIIRYFPIFPYHMIRIHGVGKARRDICVRKFVFSFPLYNSEITFILLLDIPQPRSPVATRMHRSYIRVKEKHSGKDNYNIVRTHTRAAISAGA